MGAGYPVHEAPRHAADERLRKPDECRSIPRPLDISHQIDALLPQTQCTRCGYPACRPYAEAIARGEAEINRCAPGGVEGIARLAQLLDRPVLPLDRSCGEEKSVETVARVIEADCIGCTKCIQVCPVDAIVGAASVMHTVIEAECDGCELCVPACPVDCIVMEPRPALPPSFTRAAQFRSRFEARPARLTQQARRSKPVAYDPVAAALARAKK